MSFDDDFSDFESDEELVGNDMFDDDDEDDDMEDIEDDSEKKMKPIVVENQKKEEDLPADVDFGKYLKKDKMMTMPISETWIESGYEPCYLCFQNTDSNLSRHMENYHFDKTELKKGGLHKDMLGSMKENYRKRCSNDESHFKFARIQQKSSWNYRLRDCSAHDKYRIIDRLESIGLIFCPISEPWTNFSTTPAWAPELRELYHAERDGNPDNNVPQLPSDSIGDISKDPRGAYFESSTGGTKGEMIAEVKASGLMRMLKKEDHPLLKEYYDYVLDIYKRREERKAKTAEQQATSKTNFLAKALLVSLRLTGEVGQKTIHRITDVKKEDFIRGVIAYYRCYRKVYKTGGGALNFLKNMKFFVSHVRLFDTSIFADMNWALSIEMYLSTIGTMISTANPDATAASAESRAARDVPKYYDLMQMVKPMYAELKRLADKAKNREHYELTAAFTSKEFNNFGLFAALAIVLENGQRAEVIYKVQLGYMEGIEKENPIKEGDEAPYTIPFSNSKNGQSNVYLALSEELSYAVMQYMRLRVQWKPYKTTKEPLFITSTENKCKRLFQDVKMALKQTLKIEFPYSNPAVRNSAANTYARDFLDIEGLKLTAFPAQGAMNHSLETHRKTYITNTRYLTHVGWRWLRKSAATPEILPENYNKEQTMIMEILESKGAQFSDEKPWNFEPFEWQKCQNVKKNAIGKAVDLLCHRQGGNFVFSSYPGLAEAILMAVDPAERLLSRQRLAEFIMTVGNLVERFSEGSKEKKALIKAKIVLDTLGYPYMICSTPKIDGDKPDPWRSVYFCGISDSEEDVSLDTKAPIVMVAYSHKDREYFGIARTGAADFTKQEVQFSKNGEKTQGHLITREDLERLQKRTVEYLKDEEEWVVLEELEEMEKMSFKAWAARHPGFQENEIKPKKKVIEKIVRPSTSRTPQKKSMNNDDLYSPIKRKITPLPPVTPQKRKKQEGEEVPEALVKSSSASFSLAKMFKKKNTNNVFEFKQKIYDTQFRLISGMLENPTWPLVLNRDAEFTKEMQNIKEKASSPHFDYNLAYMQYAFGIWPLIAKMEPEERMKSAHSIGQGVKATMFIPEGTIVGAFYGRHTDKEGFKRIIKGPGGAEEKKYLIINKERYCLGRTSCHREGEIGVTSMALANHSKEHPNVALSLGNYPSVNNKDVKIDEKKMPIFFRAERNINAGEELLCNYGHEAKELMSCPCDLCYGQCPCAECNGTKFHEDKNEEDTKQKIISCYTNVDGNFKAKAKANHRMLYRELEGKQLYHDSLERNDNMEKMMKKAVKKIGEALKAWDKKGDRESLGEAIEGAPGVLPEDLTNEIWERVKTVDDIQKIYGKVMGTTILIEKRSNGHFEIHRTAIGGQKPRGFLITYEAEGIRIRQLIKQ